MKLPQKPKKGYRKKIRKKQMKKMPSNQKEKIGWMALAEKSMEKIWDNKKDEKAWSRYL